MPKVIYLLRHGEAKHNLYDTGPGSYERRRDPALVDPPLTEKGVSQVQAARQQIEAMLQKNGDAGFDAVVSSTLRRALETAEVSMVPLKKADSATLIALPKMAEIQCDDIWNEPRSQSQTQQDWPKWSCQGESVLEPNQFDTAQSLIQRAEYVWNILCTLPGSVIGVSAHGCFLFFLSRRLAAAQNCRLPPFKEDKWKNGEVRRVILPEPDGKEMSWAEFGGFLEFADFDFYNRYHRRVKYVNSLRLLGSGMPHWTYQEWRWARSDSEIDAEVGERDGYGLAVRGWSLNNVYRCILCFPRCCFSRTTKIQ